MRYFCSMMDSQKTVEYEEIGTVEFSCRKGLRNIRLRVKEDEPVKLSYPAGVPFKEAERFLLSKKQWIVKSRTKLAQREVRPTLFTPETEFSTRFHKLAMQPGPEGKLNFSVANNKMLVTYPPQIKWENERIQAFIRKSITEVLRFEANRILPAKTQEFAQKHNLNLGKVSVREAKTRWGSCSGKNDISLNIHLVRLPEELMDHVILHELAHTVHKNHGKGFHDFLEKLDPKSKLHNKELKKYRAHF